MPPVPVLYAVIMLFVHFGRSVWRALRDEDTRGLVYLVIVLILAGTFFYQAVEDWRWLDAFYFTVITLTTIGYGDFSPQSDAGKLFTVVYALLGLGILGAFIAVIARQHEEGAARRGRRARRVRGTINRKPDES